MMSYLRIKNLFFNINKKVDNDENNKTREEIILKIINNELSFEKSNDNDLIFLEKRLKQVINELVLTNNYKLIKKAGRKYNYDFILINLNTNEEFKLEFKFNVDNLISLTQFVSPSKPSIYFSSSYEEYFYDNYLPRICQLFDEPLPDKEEYIKTINNNKPICVINMKNKYDLVSDINKEVKKITNLSIKNFLEISKFNLFKFSEYLLKSQYDKYYLLWKNDFNLIKSNNDDYILTDIIGISNNNSLILKNKNGKFIKVLLRWKNGIGIAFPALQISFINKLGKYIAIQ